MDFIPTAPKVNENIPYYEDVKGEDGIMKKLLPPSGSDFIDAEVREI